MATRPAFADHESSAINCFDPILTIEAEGALTRGMVIGVTGNFHSELGALPTLGRLLALDDVNLDNFRSAPVAVLGYGFWQRRFGGQADVIGRTVRVQGVPFQVIGVAPRGFKGFGLLYEPDVTVPLTVNSDIFRNAQLNYPSAGNVLWMKTAGRLRRGASVEEARAQLEAVWPAIKSHIIPPTHAGAQRDNFLAIGLDVRSLATGQESFLRPQFTRPTHVVLAIALVVLLIASINLASLMLPYVASRSHELAVRAALGASRSRALRPILLQGSIVAVVGAISGLWLGYVASTAIPAVLLANVPIPVLLNTSPDLRVLTFTGVLAIAAALVCALPSAWVATRRDSRFYLQRSGYAVTDSRRLARLLVASQVALSVILLTNAGLFARSWQRLLATDLGFTTEGVVMAGLMTRPEVDQRPDNETYYPALVDRVRVIAGVERVSLAGGGLTQLVSLMTSEPADGIPAASNAVSPGFFSSLDVRIVQGRDFSWNDHARAPRVAILSQTLARRLFPDRNPIGQRARIGTQPYRQNLEVVGIAADMKLLNDIKAPHSYAAYVPALQLGEFTVGGQLIIRGTITENQLQRAVRSVGLTFGPATGMVVLLDDAALHHEDDAPQGGDVIQWIAIERDDVGL
jgi:predicted permease